MIDTNDQYEKSTEDTTRDNRKFFLEALLIKFVEYFVILLNSTCHNIYLINDKEGNLFYQNEWFHVACEVTRPSTSGWRSPCHLEYG